MTLVAGATQESQCASCSDGFVPQGSLCTPCPQGSYFNQSSSTCALCSPGTFSGTSGQLSCSVCPTGKFSERPNASHCDSCTEGRWSDTTGLSSSSQCKYCSTGKFGNLIGLSICSDCLPRTFSTLEGASTCVQCPESSGINCELGTSNPTVNSGYWSDGNFVYPCVPQIACPGGYFQAPNTSLNLTSGTPCASGYTGNYCSSCDLEYFRLTGLCRKCIPTWAKTLVIFLAVCIVLFLCWKLALAQDRIPMSYKITFHWIQFLALYGQLSEKWPQSIRTMLGICDFLNFEVQYFGFSCGTKLSFWDVWLFKMSMPLLLAVTLVVAFYLRMRQTLDPSIHFFRVVQRRGVNVAYTLTLLSTLIFSGVFQVFNCVDQGAGVYSLLSDPSIRCYDQTWRNYIMIDGVFIIFYIIIPILAIIYISIKYRNDNSGKRKQLQLFCSPYREKCELWEFVRVFNKAIFVLMRDVSTFDRAAKSLSLLLILAVQTYVENRVSPFISKTAAQASMR
jgi:hypothetical protein